LAVPIGGGIAKADPPGRSQAHVIAFDERAGVDEEGAGMFALVDDYRG
jgi:hypothetical protein